MRFLPSAGDDVLRPWRMDGPFLKLQRSPRSWNRESKEECLLGRVSLSRNEPPDVWIQFFDGRKSSLTLTQGLFVPLPASLPALPQIDPFTWLCWYFFCVSFPSSGRGPLNSGDNPNQLRKLLDPQRSN